MIEGTQAEVGAQIDELTASLNETGLYSGVSAPIWSENGEVALVEATLAVSPNADAAFDEILAAITSGGS